MSIGTMPSITPLIPPDRERDDEAEREQHRRRAQVQDFEPNRVASQEKILIPVGTAISSVVIIIGTRSQANIPETNMWCAQTV